MEKPKCPKCGAKMKQIHMLFTRTNSEESIAWRELSWRCKSDSCATDPDCEWQDERQMTANLEAYKKAKALATASQSKKLH